MYVAISGDVFDGNDFIEQVLKQGARYAVTSRTDFKNDERVICVPDTLQGLQDLAKYHRAQFKIPVIAIGGSNGKTTTKELVAEVLSKKYKVLCTEGNLNNHIGVAKTLLRIKPEHEIAVVEIGANHLGEHAGLIEIVQPTHIIVTNNGLDHLEGFGSIENVRKANKEIFDWAREQKNVVSFVDVSQDDLVEDSDGLERVRYTPSDISISKKTQYAEFSYKNNLFTSHLAGSFNAINMLASIVIGETFGVLIENIKSAIADYKPSLMRSEILEYKGATWIVDCYNANPSSMKLAIENISADATHNHKALVLGGMREMGEYSKREHEKLVELAEQAGAELIVFVGEEFSECKISERSHYFPDSLSARKFIDTFSLENFLVLLKGSRGIKMETIINR